MSDEPCKNPNCNSCGQPHPHCRCYADGGDVIDQSQVVPDQGEEIPQDQVIPDLANIPETPESKYSTPRQQLGAAAEGVAQGIAGPLATLAETKLLGIPKEDITGRREANPWSYGLGEAAGITGSMMTGTGEAALALKGANYVADVANLGKAGSAILKGAIANGLIQAGDEGSKWILGESPDDAYDAAGAAMSHVGAAALFGGTMGGLGVGAQNKLRSLAESKAGNKISSYLAGIASAANGADREVADNAVMDILTKPNSAIPEGLSFEEYKAGQKQFDNLLNGTLQKAGPLVGGTVGHSTGGTLGGYVGYEVGKKFADPIAKSLEKIASPAARKYITPLTLKILSTNTTNGLFDALNHAGNVSAGFKGVEKGIDAMFTGAGESSISSYSFEKNKEKLDKYMKNGGIDQEIQNDIEQENVIPDEQNYAQGGHVEGLSLKKPNGVEQVFPEQNLVMNIAKGRVSNYLSSLRPQDNPPRLAFDRKPDDSAQKKTYDKALGIAVSPMKILHDIGKGTVTPDDVKHLNTMFPEVSSLLQKQITKKIIQYQLDGKYPPSRVRQGLSMFMGTALSGEYTPQGIQAAQAVFQQKQQAQAQQAPKAPSAASTKSLTKSDDAFLTGSQARQARKQRP